ncbi:hypothetical protein [Labilibaculum euxinus]
MAVKERLLALSFYLNIFLFLYFLFPVIYRIMGGVDYKELIQFMFVGAFGRTIILFFLMGVLYLWIDNFNYWRNNDKQSVMSIMLLFCFSIFYSPIYFIKRKKRKN